MSHEESIWFRGEHSSHSESLLADEVQHRLYRLLECPVFTEAVRYGDVIEADRQADGSLLFRRVAQPSSYRTWTWVISRELVDSAEVVQFCEMVLAHGGHWQRDFGGVLQVALPLDASMDPDAWYKQNISSRG